ncbi:hypothetical protein DXF85_23625 [Citrobacter pasteurii]|uniref:Uncharacterized protein n=1 Tax=Citrobacter pasteurii TaxID=1563222 RepID=A0A6N6JZZ7_9ENTR|nr:hypothetical protein [Citrobacter pasteurii]KAA1273355.1 hypothetical protein DXF85_23625 [Citrobacter pasteurii]
MGYLAAAPDKPIPASRRRCGRYAKFSSTFKKERKKFRKTSQNNLLIFNDFKLHDNENAKTNKKQTITEHFIDKKAINKNFKLVDSYYAGRYPIKTRKRQDKSLA